MKTALSILGWALTGILILVAGLLALVVLLLCIPVHLSADYHETVRLRLWYGFIPIRLLPRNKAKKSEKKSEKKSKRSKEPAGNASSKSFKKRLSSYGGLTHLPETMPELFGALSECGRLLNGFRRRVTICRLQLELICGGTDAAQAAIHYGQAWPMLLAMEQALGAVLHLKQFEGTPVLDYSAPELRLQGRILLRVMPIRLVAIALWRALKILRHYSRIKNYGKTEEPIQSKKGVSAHEQSGT